MATSSNKQRSQGGGRKSNSEPRQQVFRDFGGCNFELSPHAFTLGKALDQEQSDLQMNYVVVQNNAKITSNKTIETRNNISVVAKARSGKKFTGPAILVKNQLFLALDDESIDCFTLGSWNTPHAVTLTDKTGQNPHHNWQSFAYVDNQLIGTTVQNQLWTGPLSSNAATLSNAKSITRPAKLTLAELTAKGSLTISASSTATNIYRISLSYAHINKFGPTRHSVPFEFWANHPVEEWHGGRYLNVSLTAASDYDILATEFYYDTGNSSSLLFAGRYDYPNGDGGTCNFNWYGYLDATNMWPVANLIAPEENYTAGVPASHLTCIDGRMYFWGNSTNPQRLWIGGNPGNLLSVSPGTGGGFVDVEPGTNQEIRVVTKYKTQSGASIVTMLCDSPNTHKEQRFNLVENSVSLSNEQNMKSWQAEQVAGSVGCKSFNGAVVCADGIYSVNQYGLALTTMTMEYNSQIRTNYVSDPIKPAFITKYDYDLQTAAVIECDGVIYLAFGAGRQDSTDQRFDEILFCYDIDQKAWYTMSLDIDEPILNILHIDYDQRQEGIGIVTADNVYLLKLTKPDNWNNDANFPVTIQTGELSTTQPQQNWEYLSQLEFRFDYFRGSITIELMGIDQFGRKVTTKKTISHSDTVYNLAEYMRVDLRLQSYQIRITGTARFRLTHWIAKLYTMSAKQGLVWGFNDSQSFRSDGDIHPTFLDYNDIRKAIIP